MKIPVMITKPPDDREEDTVAPPIPLVLQIQRSNDGFRPSQAKGIGILAIVGAVLACVINAVGIWLHDKMTSRYLYRKYVYEWDLTVGYYMGAGFWASVIFTLAGSFAICAANNMTRCKMNALLVLGILGSIFAFVMTAMAISMVVEDGVRLQDGFWFIQPRVWIGDTIEMDYEAQAHARASIALSVVFLVLAIMEIVCCVWISNAGCKSNISCCSTCCCANCCCCQNDNHVDPLVTSHMSSIGAGHVIVLDSNGRPIPGMRVMPVSQSQIILARTEPV